MRPIQPEWRPKRRNRKRARARRARLLMLGCLALFVTVLVIIVARTRLTLKKMINVPALIAVAADDPPGIVLHSSDSPAVWHGQAINAAQLEKIHATDHPDWATVYEGKTYHIGYHYVILPDGTVEKGRPDKCLGCHAPHYNNWLGICIVGNFDPSSHHSWWPTHPTAAQIASVISLSEELMTKYHFSPDHVLRHRDTKMTWCPGRRFPYAAIMKQLRAYASANPATIPASTIASSTRPPVKQ